MPYININALDFVIEKSDNPPPKFEDWANEHELSFVITELDCTESESSFAKYQCVMFKDETPLALEYGKDPMDSLINLAKQIRGNTFLIVPRIEVPNSFEGFNE